MSKIYKVPLHVQDIDSEDCGPVATTMVLDYFGLESDQHKVIAEIPKSYFGTTLFDNVIYLAKKGLKVTIVTAHPKLFDGDFLRSDPSGAQIESQITRTYDKEGNKDSKEVIAAYKQFLQTDNCTLEVAIPTLSHIYTALDEGKLILALIYGQALGKNEAGYHFVVIAGYKDRQLLVLNPWPKSRKESFEDAETFMFALHCSTLFDYDNGAIAIIGK